MNYDFSKLNDREFEALGASIIEKILKKRVEKFKAGKDGGVDGRFWIGKNNEGIIQCKHYVETPYANLVSKLRSEEKKKVKNLNPKRYIFITSKKLSRHNKQEIKKIFQPYIEREDDIFGYDDLNDFLLKKENQDIVEQNLKLWITSTIVLDIIYNNAIKGRSESTVRDIQANTYKYAITENHKKGLKILNKSNVVILTGEPGIGKTTLADNLALYFVAKGFEFCDIEENISEAESLFREKEKKKILFYCDDFLGSNLYDAINNKKDSHIVKFINRVHNDDSKKFILTSRTNILNKAYSLSHIFQNGKIRDNEFLLKVENLTSLDKAKILYNHIYHSNLSKEYIDQIYEDKRYRNIINHRNYNPRIIEFITDNLRVGDVSSTEYWKYIKKSLEEPEAIWADYFQNQSDDCVRALTFLTVFNNGKISEELLRSAYNTFLKIHTVNLGDFSDKSFEAVRKLVTKSLLNRNQINEKEYEYVLFNPSITDFVLSTYADENELISNIVKSLNTNASIKFLNTLHLSKKISTPSLNKIQENLFDYFFEEETEEKDWDLLILITHLNIFNEKLNGKIVHFLNNLTKAESPNGSNLFKLILILNEYESKIELDNYEFLYNFVDQTLDEDTLKSLLDFIEDFNIDDQHILSCAEEQLDELLDEIIRNNDLGIDFREHLNNYYYPDGEPIFEFNISAIESELYQTIDSYLEDFNKLALDKIEYDSSRLVSSVDINRMASSYLESLDSGYEPDYEPRGGSYDDYSSQDDIDDIFER